MSNQNVISETNAAATTISQVLYTGKVHITGGREGSAQSEDGRLDIRLSNPGSTGTGTNPEQLLAAGWSACFIGAMKHKAAALKITLPAGTAIDTEIDLAQGDDGFSLQARLKVHLPGLAFEAAKTLVAAAHETCPYAKATRGNINVQIDVMV